MKPSSISNFYCIFEPIYQSITTPTATTCIPPTVGGQTATLTDDRCTETLHGNSTELQKDTFAHECRSIRSIARNTLTTNEETGELRCTFPHDDHDKVSYSKITVRYLRSFPTAFYFTVIVVDLDTYSKRIYPILKGNNLIISYNFSQNQLVIFRLYTTGTLMITKVCEQYSSMNSYTCNKYFTHLIAENLVSRFTIPVVTICFHMIFI